MLGRIYRRHRAAQAVRAMAWTGTPLLGVAAGLHLGRLLWSGLDSGLAPMILAGVALLAWIPLYVLWRSPLLRIAHEADEALSARGAVTAAAELSRAGGPATPWGQAALDAGARILAKADVGALVPAGRFLPALAPLGAALVAAAMAFLPVLVLPGKMIEPPDPEGRDSFVAVPLWSAADERMLDRVHEKLRSRLDLLPAESGDARVDSLRQRLDEALATFPEDEEGYRSFMQDVEAIKQDMDALVEQKALEQQFVEELGQSMDAGLLQDLAEALEKGDTGDAAEVAEALAEKFEKDNPKGSDMSKAAEELLEAIEKAKPLLEQQNKGENEQDVEKQQNEGENGQGVEKQQNEGAEDGSMDSEKLADLLETLDKLAGMLGIKDADSLPEGLKKLGEKLSGMDASDEQLDKLGELVEGLDNLQNLMNGAAQDGKESYKKLREDFESSAEGNPGGQPGQQQGGKPGEMPGGKPGSPGQPGQGTQPDGQQGQGTMPGQEGQPGQGTKPGQGKEGQAGAGQGAGEEPGGKSGEAEEQGKAGEDGKGDGKQGYGTASTDHMGDTPILGDQAIYEDIQVEGEDNPGPVKKDVILGASKEGFVDEDYKIVYDQYSSILQDIMDGEQVPSIYRFYVDKYFQLIAPRTPPQ